MLVCIQLGLFSSRTPNLSQSSIEQLGTQNRVLCGCKIGFPVSVGVLSKTGVRQEAGESQLVSLSVGWCPFGLLLIQNTKFVKLLDGVTRNPK